jgi:type I restriction enzyme S subunit
MVPNGWKLGKISDLANTKMGYAFKSSDFVSSGIPLLRMGNLYQNSLDFSRNPAFLPFSYEKDYENFVVKPNDLVMSMTGTMGKRDYGFTVQIPEDAPISLLNQRVMKFIAKKDISSGYLMYVLRSEALLNKLYSFPGGTKQANLSADQVKEISVLIPSFEEQNKIAQILSTWDQAISATEKLLENSQQQKKALMQQLLTGNKRLLDENGVNFSEGWNEYSLGNLGNTFTGLTGKTKDDFGSGVPYITYMNIFKNSRIDINQVDYVVVKEDENQNSVRYGDIFFTTSSETADEVGMSSVLLEEVERLYLNSFCFGFRLNNFKVLLPQFAAYILRSSNIRKQISILGQGATRYNLSKNQLMKLILRLPTIAEQKKIAEVLYLADQEIETLKKKLDCLKQEKKALMQQLLTGKKRVKVAA